MLSLALTFELRSLLRNAASAVALLGFLAVGGLAIVVGERHVAQWHDEITMAEAAEAESAEEARGYLAKGESGPEDKPWIDLTRPQWQDQFAGARLVRQPAALAGVAAGAVDSAPAAFLVNRWARPTSAGGYRIENPELAAGAVDLIFVLTLLVPLLLGTLGLGIGARERDSGLAALIAVQAGAVRGWMVARTLAVAAIVGTASTTLCLGAGLVGGASMGEAWVLVAFALVYTLLWSGLLLVVNAGATTVRAAATGFGVIWTVLCILGPALATEVAFDDVDQDFAMAETVDARARRWAVWERDWDDVMREFHVRYPKLPPLEEELTPGQKNVVRGAIEAALFRELHAENLNRQRNARRLAERAAWLSPTVAVTLGLERLAGVGADAGFAYRGALQQAVDARIAWVVETAWTNEPLTAADFEALVASSPSPFESRPQGLAGPFVALFIWAAAAWALALTATRSARSRASAETRG